MAVSGENVMNMAVSACFVTSCQELAERLRREEALRIKQDAKVRFDKDQEQRMRDELGR